MSNRRVKDIDFEDDDYDDGYYDETEDAQDLAPADREQMRIGTAKVREALGSSDHISDNAIQEALWHYYYDVGKSATYLKNQHTPKKIDTSVKAKPLSRFDQAQSAASAASPLNNAGRSLSSFNSLRFCVPETLELPTRTGLSDHDFDDRPTDTYNSDSPHFESFRGVSWDSLPSHTKALGTIEPTRPKLRLMGGSLTGTDPGTGTGTGTGKVSKLAALAAARKQKDAQKTDAPSAASPASAGDSLLSRLGSKRPAPDNTLARPSPAEIVSSRQPTDVNSTLPIRSDTKDIPSAIPQDDARAQPSIFAKVMCTSISPNHNESRQYNVRNALASAFFGSIGTSGSDSSNDRNVVGALSGPSPDDIVTSAQAKGFKQQDSKSKASTPITSPAKKTLQVDSAVRSMNKLDVSDSPTTPKSGTKRKRINVIDEYEKAKGKPRASFVVVGHVDHGKSTLMGRLLCDLKIVDQRSIDKYRAEATKIDKASFALAWVMDSTPEERARGVTVDIATNSFETPNRHFTILDAPGHRDFIPNMLAGASQADFAVLVVDASTNSFEAGLRGQTKEHALLVRSTGVQNIVVAINKMDAAQWSEERYEEIKQQMSAFLTTAGFQAEKLTFIPCAGLSGDNIVSAPPAAGSWYTGDTLVQALESYEPVKAQITLPFRMPISDVFRGGVTHPLSISGKIEAGSIQLEDSMLVVPSGEVATVKGIEIDDGSATEFAVAGQMATLHLSDIDPIHLHVGDMLCDPEQPVKAVKTVTAKALAFDHILPVPVELHRGRLFVAGKITRIEATLAKATGSVIKKRPKIVQPGSIARVRIELDRAVPLEVMQRVVLRSEGTTVAAGVIEATLA